MELSLIERDGESTSFSSMKAETLEEKKVLFEAMNNPTFSLRSQINRRIVVKDVFVEMVQITDQKTGELRDIPRIILIDTDGKSYACMSTGVYSSLKRLFTLFGPPTWEPGLAVMVKNVERGENQVLTLTLVG